MLRCNHAHLVVSAKRCSWLSCQLGLSQQTSSLSGKHDELDFEFLGNEPGRPYVLQTNVYALGVGDREQRIRLWFDPTEDFHTYELHWNKEIVM